MGADPRPPGAGPRPLEELRLVSRSPEATEALGEALGARLAAGCVVALDGDLGAGKTTLVRGLARGLGVAEGVASPTYTLMHAYDGRVPVYHFDAWMQGREEAFLEGGGAEWLEAGGVALVEWADRVADWLPAARLSVRIEHARSPLGSPGSHGSPEADSGRRHLHLAAFASPDLARLLAHLVLPEGIEGA